VSECQENPWQEGSLLLLLPLPTICLGSLSTLAQMNDFIVKTKPWVFCPCEFCHGLTPFNAFEFVFVVVDQLTKMIHFVLCTSIGMILNFIPLN
jgi:hypothetical protein